MEIITDSKSDLHLEHHMHQQKYEKGKKKAKQLSAQHYNWINIYT